MNQELFKSTLEIIQKDFDLTVGVSESQIKEFLTAALVQLLLHDLEKLWNILYRIDVDENKVKAVFNASDPTEIAPKLAELIYKRAEQKALTRLKYR